ncbi:hypothetical protein ACJJIW_11210 [Microbulbifer sp. JMSA004]|uniref:hypothetical protein n=1 Tax=unclassified Microbulbifer TaxID=2619833 RepID=UPI00403B0A9C
MIADIDSFEGTFCDLTPPGYYSIEKDGQELIKISSLEVEGRILNCQFEVLKSNYSREEIEELVYVVMLKRFCDDFYLDQADFVKFHNLKTNEEWKIIYLG